MSKKGKSKKSKVVEMPEEFEKIVCDFLNDIQITFPEYIPIINKWWKTETPEEKKKTLETIFKHCLKKYPPRFFDILYQNEDMFKDNDEQETDQIIDTEFFPQIHFKNLWNCELSDKTRETIWKYLQLVLFTIVGCVDNKASFGDTAQLFDFISEDEFKTKLEDTMAEMQKAFETGGTEMPSFGDMSGVDTDMSEEDAKRKFAETLGISAESLPSPDDVQNHINKLVNGKLGRMAMEFAEEFAEEMNIDMENTGDIKSMFQKLFKNPGKLMSLVKNMGKKMEEKMKSGEIKESELIAESKELFEQMKNMPGMGNINQMLGKMGIPGMGKGSKMNFGAMEAQLNSSMRVAQMKERMKQKLDDKNKPTNSNSIFDHTTPNIMMTDEELVKVFRSGEKPEKSMRKKK